MFRLTTRVAVSQTVILAAVASVAWAGWGQHIALSAAFGVVVALLTTLLSVWRERQSVANEAWSAQRHMRRLFRLEAERMFLAAGLMALGFASGYANPLALLSGFVLAQLGWLAVLQKQPKKTEVQ